jgi:hypothetical protein
MHICVSDIVKRKLNLTDKFVFGGILPDLLKSMTKNRDATHYIEKVMVDDEVRKLPNIQKAIDELELDDGEIKLGYIAHLIEDLIWFNNYIPTYAKIEDVGNVKYLIDGTIHKECEFDQEIYSDYSNSNEYVVKKCNVDIEQTINNLLNIAGNKIDMQPLLENSVYPTNVDIKNNKFMMKQDIDKYIEECTNEVEKVVLKLMGE